MCKMHYLRARRKGTPHRPTPEQRFWLKVDTSGDCWLWAGTLRPDGYGRFGVDGQDYYAHRWAYQLLIGPIPEGLTLDHLCRVRHCVNPEHLEPVTNAENVRRGEGITARQSRQDRCLRGHLYAQHGAVTKKGWRQCRACQRLWQRRKNERLALVSRSGGMERSA